MDCTSRGNQGGNRLHHKTAADCRKTDKLLYTVCIVCFWKLFAGCSYRFKSDGILIVMVNRMYRFLMNAGNAAGCHQIPERSFFYRGYQFPVCARCTGVILGQIAGGISILFNTLSYDTVGFLCFVMFFDWWLQRVHLLQSTNLRRFTTGTLCGFAVGNSYAQIICKVWQQFLL